jgi:isoleucyl-tRNA synthetase
VRLEPGEYELLLRPRNATEGRTLPDNVGVVILDTTTDDDLESEGQARDVVRLVQAQRRAAGLHVSDCIDLVIVAPAATARAIERHEAYVREQTLAVTLAVTVGPELSIEVARTPCPSP